MACVLLTVVLAAVAAEPVDYDAHIAALRESLPEPAEHYTIVVQAPFVVIGDGEPEQVRRRAERTVGWAAAQFRTLYFEKDPPHIIDIWLLRNRDSYDRHMREVFGREPTTPYGCYLSADRALVMNIATGGGTLVHEIVHPFVEANFPECPAWFNEGLGSLYEQSGERDGTIVGYTNWRLAGLQETISDQGAKLPTIEQLCAMSGPAFYHDDRGNHYAMARYLCYYLQEHGLLQRYYHAFAANRADDPTGYDTLQHILNEDDMADFQHRWEQYVLELTFP